MPPASASGASIGLEWLDYVAVLGYFALTCGIVIRSSLRQKSTDDFFLASRRMPWFAVGLSIMATLLSTISYSALPGEMIKHGITLFIGYLSLPLTMLVVLFLWVPFFMRLRLTSAYEYLEQRFDYRARLLGGSLFFLLRLGWMSMVVFTASQGAAAMTGYDVYALILGVGAAATIYTCMGGIRALIWTDVLQAFMLLGGTLMILAYVAWDTGSGPLDWWSNIAAHSPQHTQPVFFSFDLTLRMTIVTIILDRFAWAICTHGSDQVVLQRYFTTESLRAARGSYLVNMVAELTMMLLLATTGLALLSFYLKNPTPGVSLTNAADKVMPYFFANELPAGLGGLILAGFLSDAMQTLNSGVNSISAVATKDIFERSFPSGARWMSELTLARVLTIGIGIAVTMLAYGLAYNAQHSDRNLVDLMPRFNMFLGPLASLFFIGMFLPRCTARSALPAVLCGLAVSFVWSWWQELFGTAYKPTITLTVAAPCMVAFAVAGLLSLLMERAEEHPGKAYTWWSVLRRPSP